MTAANRRESDHGDHGGDPDEPVRRPTPRGALAPRRCSPAVFPPGTTRPWRPVREYGPARSTACGHRSGPADRYDACRDQAQFTQAVNFAAHSGTRSPTRQSTLFCAPSTNHTEGIVPVQNGGYWRGCRRHHCLCWLRPVIEWLEAGGGKWSAFVRAAAVAAGHNSLRGGGLAIGARSHGGSGGAPCSPG
jgi:hypothetical protein